MLAEERRSRIARIINERGSAGLAELSELLDASESTLRRDIQALDAAGIVRRVHGGKRKKWVKEKTPEDLRLHKEHPECLHEI